MFKEMKLVLIFLLFIVSAGIVHAGMALDVGFFYDELAPYGEWVSISPYGWAWVPAHMEPGWRPYMDGYWAYTDFGWTWASDEDWGWATYHYGRWTYDDVYGWVWIPDTVWGPAWVAWRYGGGYIGWAPLPPGVAWMEGGGLDWGDFDFEHGFGWHWWNFTEERWFFHRKLKDHIVEPDRNFNLMKESKNITNYTVENKHIINHGLEIEQVERTTHEKVPRLVIQEPQTMEKKHVSSVEGNHLIMFRPQISQGKTEKTPTSTAPKQTFDYEAEKQKLRTYHEKQTERLKGHQDQTVPQAAPGTSKENVSKPPQEQMEAVMEHQKHEMQVLENRAKRAQEKAPRAAERPGSGEGRKR